MKRSEELRTQNARITKENDKYRERYINLDTLIRDINAQNEQLEKDRQNFIQKLNQMQVKLYSKDIYPRETTGRKRRNYQPKRATNQGLQKQKYSSSKLQISL
jgi:hypothetical protein